jgi:hypothetical protein
MRSACVVDGSGGSRRGAARRTRRSTLVLSDSRGTGLLAACSCRLADRLLARAFGFRLDRRLAAGGSPDSSRLLAARAQDLVSAATREALADCWEHLLGKARRTPPPGDGVMTLCRDRVVAAEPEVRDLIAHLRTALPVAARGVAAASVLLRDGAGPVYSRRAPAGLRDALRLATAHLDPSVPLFASSSGVS